MTHAREQDIPRSLSLARIPLYQVRGGLTLALDTLQLIRFL